MQLLKLRDLIIYTHNMRDIKESHSDAVDLVEDIFTAEYLKEILFDNLDDSLVYWAEFEQALNEASDNPDIEEQLIAMDNEIKDIALERLFKRIKITLK